VKLMALLDEVEQFIENSRRLPFTEKVIIDADQLLDYLDQIREALPSEMEEAKRIYRDREKIMKEAREEAEQLLEEARARMARMVENHEVSRQAQGMAEEVVAQARQIAREIRQGANEYADEVLKKIEEVLEQASANLEKSIATVKNGREELKKMKGHD